MAKINKSGGNRASPGRTLYVPKAIGELIPEGTEFEAELVEEGILFRRQEPGQPSKSLPSWVRIPNNIPNVPD